MTGPHVRSSGFRVHLAPRTYPEHDLCLPFPTFKMRVLVYGPPHTILFYVFVSFLIPFPPVSTSSCSSSGHRIFLFLGLRSKIILTRVAELSVPLMLIGLLCALLSCLRKLVKISNGGRINFSSQHQVKIVFLPGGSKWPGRTAQGLSWENFQKGHVLKDRTMNGWQIAV